MFNRQITVDITEPDGIDKAINELLEIEKELDEGIKEVVRRLADIGIKVANDSAGEEFKPYIDFVKEVESEDKNHITLHVIGKNIAQMISAWDLKDGTHRYVEVDAILMNEVGSGREVNNPDGLEGGERGALNTYGHAFSPNGWYWVDDEGKHHSYGSRPNLSVHNAFIQMNRQINDVVREVFR